MESLPASGYYNYSSKYWGAQALPSPGGYGVILQSQAYLFELTCDSTGCTWTQMSQELNVPVHAAVMSYLPGGYTPICHNSPISGTLKATKNKNQEINIQLFY